VPDGWFVKAFPISHSRAEKPQPKLEALFIDK